MTSSNDGDGRGRFARVFGRRRSEPATPGASDAAAAAGPTGPAAPTGPAGPAVPTIPTIPTSPVDPAGPTVLAAPVTGTAVTLAETEDPAFSTGILGPGAAVRPTAGEVVSPVTGTVVSAMPHAYGLRTDSGVEVLVHVGVDTVGLEGLHFTPHVAQGQHVAAGAPLVSVDLAAVAAAGYPTTVILVVTKAPEAQTVEACAAGPVEAGQPWLTVAA